MLSATLLSNDRAAFSLDVRRSLYPDGAASCNANAALERQSGVRLMKTLLRDRRAASLTLNTAPDGLSGVKRFILDRRPGVGAALSNTARFCAVLLQSALHWFHASALASRHGCAAVRLDDMPEELRGCCAHALDTSAGCFGQVNKSCKELVEARRAAR